MDELPPELAHITANFQPLSRLFDRTAQECYNDLGDIITALAGIPQQINGEATVNGAGFVSPANAQKRLKWIGFANMHRERFIKLLVVLRWSKNLEQVSKIIDLVSWIVQQNSLYDGVDDGMASLRRGLDNQKVPAPDLGMALDILASGKSSKMPAVCLGSAFSGSGSTDIDSSATISLRRLLPTRFSRLYRISIPSFTCA
jgi:mediator of RNA polymerase II transcription subunit 14